MDKSSVSDLNIGCVGNSEQTHTHTHTLNHVVTHTSQYRKHTDNSCGAGEVIYPLQNKTNYII